MLKIVRTIRTCSVVMALFVSASLACGQASSRPGRIVTTSAPVAPTDSELSSLGLLIGVSGDQLRNEYSADKQSCAVPFRPYVALRLAEKNYHFYRGDVLREMCARRTTSFAFALQSAAGVYGTLTTPGAEQNQKLREAEREYLRQIDGALRPRQGK